MSNKQIVFCIAILFMLLSLSSNVLAAINATEENALVNKGYTWLSDAVRGKWPAGTEDSAFSLLALAYDDSLAAEGRTALIGKSRNDGECWPKDSCNVKDTALAVMALARIGQDTSRAEEWLMMQNSTPSELNWYMQLDSPEKAICMISYNHDGFNYNITLEKNKKIDKAAGYCLSPSYGNYWFKIARDCYEQKFTISCDKEFFATLFYQKPGLPSIFISSDTKKESAGGEAALKINSICLKSQEVCDYEGTAWAAVALSKKSDVSVFIPYLVGYSGTNTNILPEAFLLMLTGQDDYANSLISKFKREGYWSVGSYSSQYSTALALLALKDRAPKQKDIAKNWLLKEQAKTGPDAGSWQSSKKDTGFVLYSVWPKDATYVGTQQTYCSDYGYFCTPTYDCDYDLRLLDYYCSGTDVCCKQKQEEESETCSRMGGLICSSNDICTGTSRSATDGLCCLGECEKQEASSECEKAGYTCRFSPCEEGEAENSMECLGTRICCESATAVKKKNKAWIWILLLLIMLAGVAAYIFRDKLNKLMFKFKPRGNRGMSKPFRFPPAPPAREIVQARTPPARAMARPSLVEKPREISSNKELEETLRKLREGGM